MKKIIGLFILFFSFLGFGNALNFSLETESVFNQSDRIFYEIKALPPGGQSYVISPVSMGYNYGSPIKFDKLNFVFSADYPFLYHATSSTSSITETGQQFWDYFNDTTLFSISQPLGLSSSFFSNRASKMNFASRSSSSGFSFGFDVANIIVQKNPDGQTRDALTGGRYGFIYGNTFDGVEKIPIDTFLTTRFFTNNELFSGGLIKDINIDQVKLFGNITYDGTSANYHYGDGGKRFYDIGNKGAHFLGHGNSYAYISTSNDKSESLISRNTFLLNGRSSIPLSSNVEYLNAFSGGQYKNMLLLNSDGFKQRKGTEKNETIAISKSSEFPQRLRVDIYGCKTSFRDDLLDENKCPLIKKGRLKYNSSTEGTVRANKKIDWNGYSRNTGINVLPFSDLSSGFPINAGTNWDFVSFTSLNGRSSNNGYFQDFNYDGQYLEFSSSYILNSRVYGIRYTIQQDSSIPLSIAQQVEQIDEGYFQPLFSGGVPTGGFVIPGQSGFVLSGDTYIVDVNRTGFIESNLGIGFRAFYCPYDYGFVEMKLSSIPGLGILANTSIDFDILKPISCIFSSYGEGVKEMKLNNFPKINILSGNIINQSNLLYVASNNSKNLFSVILNLLLGFLGLYLFIKWIK